MFAVVTIAVNLLQFYCAFLRHSFHFMPYLHWGRWLLLKTPDFGGIDFMAYRYHKSRNLLHR